RQGWYCITKWGYRLEGMLEAELDEIAFGEGRSTGEPLVDDDGEGVLVAGGLGLATELFGGHVDGSASDTLCAPGGGALGDGGNAEVTEDDLFVASQQQVL